MTNRANEIADLIETRLKEEGAVAEIDADEVPVILAALRALATTEKRFIKGWSPPCHSWYGEVLASVSWDAPDDTLVVRYWYDPGGDPPRKPYTLVERKHVKDCELPQGYVQANGPWP